MTSALDIARGYLVDHGWSVVPVPHMSKGPILPDWQKLGITADTIEQYFNGGEQNIGVMMGVVQSNLADADFDCRETRVAASYRFPPTAMFGRE